MKTLGVKLLVAKVLGTLQMPCPVHAIDEVGFAIQTNDKWLRDWHALGVELGPDVVKKWCGRWVAHALGRRGGKEVASRRNSLMESYSLLDDAAGTARRKPNEQEALQEMADYYQANRDWLPDGVRRHRDTIVRLLMEGMPVAEAFAAVLEEGPDDRA